MKYKYAQLFEVIISSSNVSNDSNITPDEIPELLQGYLLRGFEIYKCIPVSTNTVGGIKYILRKEV